MKDIKEILAGSVESNKDQTNKFLSELANSERVYHKVLFSKEELHQSEDI